MVARSGDRVLWTFAFPPGSGATRGLLVRPEAVYVGHGNSLLTLDPATGVVQDRLALPSQVTGIVADAAGLTVTTETETVVLRGESRTSLPFAPEPALFGWLQCRGAGRRRRGAFGARPDQPLALPARGAVFERRAGAGSRGFRGGA